MKIKKLSFYSYRNLVDGEIDFCDDVNVFIGDNAQGKTNLLEAMWLCTGMRSFRGSKDSETVAFGKGKMKISVDFYSKGREQSVDFIIDRTERSKKLYLNGIAADVSRIAEVYTAVVFSPQNLSVITGGPIERRRFVDTALCQLKPGSVRLITEYQRALFQRNTVLKEAAITENLNEMLDIFEEAIARLGAELMFQRYKYLSLIKGAAEDFFSGLTMGNEKLELEYTGGECSDKQAVYGRLLSDLKESRKNDIRMGYTSVGPHRDDISVIINGLEAKVYGSQGQKRSCALALKLAEAKILEDFSGEKPAILLDDVMSELDHSRQKYILSRLYSWQVFITGCDRSIVKNGEDGEKSKFFSISGGKTENVSSFE